MEDRPPQAEARPVAAPAGEARPGVALVGAGIAATALAAGLKASGWPVAGLFGRRPDVVARRAALLGIPSLDAPAVASAPVIVLAISDGAIASVARELAASAGPWPDRIALHVSGALTSDEAAPLREAGAAVASWHPLATLAAAAASRELPAGIPFFIEGDDAAALMARRLSLALRGTAHRIAAESKPAYHAAATLGGNLVTVLFAAAADVLRGEGVADPEAALALLARQSLDAAIAHPGLEALTGPVSRGDAGTLAAHVRALGSRPAALRAAHAALSLAAHERLASEGRGAPAANGAVDAVLREALLRAVRDLGR